MDPFLFHMRVARRLPDLNNGRQSARRNYRSSSNDSTVAGWPFIKQIATVFAQFDQFDQFHPLLRSSIQPVGYSQTDIH